MALSIDDLKRSVGFRQYSGGVYVNDDSFGQGMAYVPDPSAPEGYRSVSLKDLGFGAPGGPQKAPTPTDPNNPGVNDPGGPQNITPDEPTGAPQSKTSAPNDIASQTQSVPPPVDHGPDTGDQPPPGAGSNAAPPVAPSPVFSTPVLTPPTLAPAPAFSYKNFTAPSPDDALNDPGYKFRLQQGTSALQNWAAARGTLNDTGTAKALEDYGQNAGSQEYQNVWNRSFQDWNAGFGNALSTYNTNYQTQIQNPYNAAFQGWSAGTANPTMATFDANVGSAMNGYNAFTNRQNLGYTTQANLLAQMFGINADLTKTNYLTNADLTKTNYLTQNQNNNLVYSTDAAWNQHLNDANTLQSWNQWLQDWNIFRDQRDSTFNKYFQYATA